MHSWWWFCLHTKMNPHYCIVIWMLVFILIHFEDSYQIYRAAFLFVALFTISGTYSQFPYYFLIYLQVFWIRFLVFYISLRLKIHFTTLVLCIIMFYPSSRWLGLKASYFQETSHRVTLKMLDIILNFNQRDVLSKIHPWVLPFFMSTGLNDFFKYLK